MRIRQTFLAILPILLVPTLAYADRTVAFCEYSYLPELMQIRVTKGFIHLPGPVTLETLNDPSLEKTDVFSLEPTSSAATYRRSATIEGKTVEIEISASPPAGNGLGGAVATSHITASINGTKVVDAPLDSVRAQIDVLSIMPANGMVFVSGSYDGKLSQGFIFLNSKNTLTEAWLASHASP